MKKNLFITALTVLSLISCQEQDSAELGVASAAKPKSSTSYRLGDVIDKSQFQIVWQDDFSSDQLDTNIWERTVKADRIDWHDGVKITTKTNSLVSDTDASNGVLKIALRKTSLTDTYARGFVRAKDAYAQKYGYFEAKIWLPAPWGYQGGFWMMPVGNSGMGCNSLPCSGGVLDSATDGAEIDIIEGTGGQINSNYRYSTNVHIDGYYTGHPSSFANIYTYEGVAITNTEIYGTYHTYGLHWTATFLRYYIDGVLVREITADKWISDVSEFIILSTGISPGGWDGTWVPSNLPANMLVDWVKVWKKKP